jgi:hypothetical protein
MSAPYPTLLQPRSLTINVSPCTFKKSQQKNRVPKLTNTFLNSKYLDLSVTTAAIEANVLAIEESCNDNVPANYNSSANYNRAQQWEDGFYWGIKSRKNSQSRCRKGIVSRRTDRQRLVPQARQHQKSRRRSQKSEPKAM